MNVKRLVDAKDWSYKALDSFRKERIAALRQFVGSHYSQGNGTDAKVPVNLLELAVNTYGQQLAARAPRVSVSARYDSLSPTAYRLQLAMNHMLKKMDFGDVLMDAVQNAIFGMGIIKVSMTDDYVYDDEEPIIVGSPKAVSIQLDDWVHDMTVKNWDDVKFLGAKSCYTEDQLLRAGFSKAKVRKLVQSGSVEENRDVSELEEGLSRSTGKQEEYENTYDVWEIFLPTTRKVVFFADGAEDLLDERTFEGPESGPYHTFKFSRVSGNTMPLPPVALWRDLHELTNTIFRKLGRQAERQKTIMGYAGGSQSDASRIVDSADGEAIQMDNPQNAKEYRFGGVDQVNLAFMIQLKGLFTYMAGNLDSLGGLSAQSETATQDKMLLEGASKRLGAMQREVLATTRGVIRDLAWFLWTDPLIELPMTAKIQGVDVRIPVVYSPEERRGEYLDYNVDIEPYSMQDNSPSKRVSNIMQILQTVILPAMPLLQQQNVFVDFGKLLNKLSEYMDLPELGEILVYNKDPQGGPYGAPPAKMQEQQKPAFTNRTVTRINRPGATSQGQDATMMQTLLGGNPQPAEMAGIGRSLG